MCMITYLPPFVKVPVKGIMNGAQWNDDGHGWAVAAATDLMIRGRYMDSETALDTFLTAREAFPEAPALFHSRWATHGLPLVKNCHPFYVTGRDTVVAHNGVMPAWLCPVGKDTRSDTALMAQEWLGYQTRGTWTRKERKRIGAIIGLGNKLVILSVSSELAKPRGFIVNQGQGQWAPGGAWFSNGDYQHGYMRSRSYDSGNYSWIGGAYVDVDAKRNPSQDRAGTYHAFGGDDECPQCFAKGGIDPVANQCTYCDFCCDCFNQVHGGECECTGYTKWKENDKGFTITDDYHAANAQILEDNRLLSIAQHAIKASEPGRLVKGAVIKSVDTNPDIGLFKEPEWSILKHGTVDTADDNLSKALAIYDGDAALEREDKENPLVSIKRGELNGS